MLDNIAPLGAGSRIKHPEMGIGVILGNSPVGYYTTFIKFGRMEIPHTDELEVIEAVPQPDDMISMNEVLTQMKSMLQHYGAMQEVVDLGTKWQGGKLILQPQDESLKPKEMPIETFFHKIVMTRDRLRVMEQRINSSKNLSDEEKVNLQQYLSRIYGSLTSFNVLFAQKKDQFSS